MVMQTISPVKQTDEIVRLENLATSATVQLEIEKAISGIDKITREAVDNGAFSYGLRVLSRFPESGYDEKTLREKADRYNHDGPQLRERLGLSHSDLPHIHSFWMADGSGYKEIDLDYKHSPSHQ